MTRSKIGDFDGDSRIDPVVQPTLGYAHACVRVADGTVRCWGSNDEGQPGYGTTDDIGDDETLLSSTRPIATTLSRCSLKRVSTASLEHQADELSKIDAHA